MPNSNTVSHMFLDKYVVPAAAALISLVYIVFCESCIPMIGYGIYDDWLHAAANFVLPILLIVSVIYIISQLRKIEKRGVWLLSALMSLVMAGVYVLKLLSLTSDVGFYGVESIPLNILIVVASHIPYAVILTVISAYMIFYIRRRTSADA